jgi:cytochrome c-type biogenesis protein CcmH/NrfG
VTEDDVQSLVDEATFDYVSGEPELALAKLGRATAAVPAAFEAWHAVAEINLGLRRLDAALAAGERAHALRPGDPLAIATLSRTWMERGDKAKAEHFGALARVQSWKDELKAPPAADAGGLH